MLELENCVNPAIQFTIQISDNNLLFLDIFLNKQDNKIWINIYSKPTDLIQLNSNHPKPCSKNIKFCLAHRIYAIVENAKIRTAKLSELKTTLRNQKYHSKHYTCWY